MKRLLLLSGLCLLGFGCAEPVTSSSGATAEAVDGTHLEKVDTGRLDSLLTENSINVVEFSAVW